MERNDPLTPAARHARLATWGTPPPQAERMARGITAELARTVHLPRAAARARHVPPALPERRLDASQLDGLARIVAMHADDDSRRAYSLGKSYPDLVAARSGRLERACDAVVRPTSEDELRRTLDWLAERGVAVVPVGGGTSVVGGIEPIGSRADQPVVALDVSRIDACLGVSSDDRVATFQAGVHGPMLEAQLAPRGLTLGHMPQSFAYSTLGGWIATRSSGQASLRYGRIEALTAGMRVMAPSGTIEVEHLPAHGAGPDLGQLLMGSEGAYGVITQATMRVSRLPERVRFGTWMSPSFEDSMRAARTLVQAGIHPAMLRVSDAAETAFALGSSVRQRPLRALGKLAARAAGLAGEGGPSMLFVVGMGSSSEVAAMDRAVTQHMRRVGLKDLGPLPARHWYQGRFVQPYVRDLLLQRGLIVDTLETAAPWSRLAELHTAVREALEQSLGRGRAMVGCHLSHMYRDGASAYFTFIADAAPGSELERWRAAKRAVHAVLAQQRVAVSHQHGVGTMHADLYRELTPAAAVSAWRAARASFDPDGIMSPGRGFSSPVPGLDALNAVPAGAVPRA